MQQEESGRGGHLSFRKQIAQLADQARQSVLKRLKLYAPTSYITRVFVPKAVLSSVLHLTSRLITMTRR